MATTLASEWVFWHTGRINFLTFTMEADALLRLIGIGAAVIVAAAVLFGLRMRRR